MEGTVREAMREERALVGAGKEGNALTKVEPVFKWGMLEEVAAPASLPGVVLARTFLCAAGFAVTGLADGFAMTFLAPALGVDLALGLAAGLVTALAFEAAGFFATGLAMGALTGLTAFFADALAVGLATFGTGLATALAGLADLGLATGTGAFFTGLPPLAAKLMALGLATGFLSLALAALALVKTTALPSGFFALAGTLVFFAAAFTCCLPAEITASCAKLALSTPLRAWPFSGLAAIARVFNATCFIP